MVLSSNFRKCLQKIKTPFRLIPCDHVYCDYCSAKILDEPLQYRKCSECYQNVTCRLRCKDSKNGLIIDENAEENKFAFQNDEIFHNEDEITIKVEDLEHIIPQTPPNENNFRNLGQNSAKIDCR